MEHWSRGQGGESRSLPLISEPMKALWQRREMIIPLLHGEECTTCREALAALYALERTSPARDFGIVRVDPKHAEQVARAFAVAPGEASVGVVDRFTRLFAVLDVHAAEPSELAREARSWIDFIQSQCEECGAPVW